MKLKKKNALTNQNLIILGILCIIYFVAGQLSYPFIDSSNYIDNSKKITLNNVKFILHERQGYGLGVGPGTGKEVVKIFDREKYYDLIYYEKNKADFNFFEFDYSRVPRNIEIKLNTTEYLAHTGAINDSIPVFNFSILEGDLMWENDSYHNNVKTYLIYEKALKFDKLMPPLVVCFIFSLSLLLIRNARKVVTGFIFKK